MKLFYAIFFLFSCILHNIVVIQASEGVLEVFESVYDLVIDIEKEVEKKFLVSENIFQISKQVLIGLPEMLFFNIFHELCSLYMGAEKLEPGGKPDIRSMYIILHQPCVTSHVYLIRAHRSLFRKGKLDIQKKVVIFVSGWIKNPNADYINDMAAAFNCRGDYNFLALDISGQIHNLQTWAAYNTAEVGRALASFLEKLVKKVPLNNIHLIGHSLGSHIVGYAGRYFNKYTGLNITRITGLDPANPCYNEGQILSGLQRGDAEFVDIIHTNPDVLGKGAPMGDIDFYPEGMAPLKPGCLKLGCSHEKALEYFTESVFPGNERNFLAVRCTSVTDLKLGFCNGVKYAMGFAVPSNLKGNYFLGVNAEKPYGRHSTSQYKVADDCGKCKEIYD